MQNRPDIMLDFVDNISILLSEHTSWGLGSKSMCRNIRPLFNFEPPATEDEIRAAALQYVRKISGVNKPSHANESAFEAAVDAVTKASTALLAEMQTNSAPKDRAVVAARAKARSLRRFSSAGGSEGTS
jgi:hypothetical protein